MIEVKNLYKRYHNHHGSDWVLKNINLTIPKGVSVGLIGPNGAGKSTLLRLIAGMDSPERGEVIRHSRVSWPVGLAGGMQNNMTGRQNVKFVARAQGCRPDEVKRVIAFVENFAEIGDAFDEPVRTYSSGMRARLSFGLSLSFDFDVYISDEATAVGDRAFKAKAKALFESKVGQASIIMVSHSEGILKDLCQAGVYIKDGEAFWYDSVEAAIRDYHKDTDAEKAKRKNTAVELVPGLPSDLNGARQHLKQCRNKRRKANEALQTAKEQQFLPRLLQFIEKDVAQRYKATEDAFKHLKALEEKEALKKVVPSLITDQQQKRNGNSDA
ncbi:ABC transporter ATP-binding protein [Halomonas sp. IOP_6]|uniref:ABC transporter ATP-binding protein n=1 Tax=Halomonadaceae TaxID=28256 RepID=UPI001E383598|nr:MULTISPECIES: ABC transporter ATP-binding protein [Halomonas]MCD6003906.1 ABC transporter ATP-binding protein [Halomonas sp. IOP_6]